MSAIAGAGASAAAAAAAAPGQQLIVIVRQGCRLSLQLTAALFREKKKNIGKKSLKSDLRHW
jgi:hypothetical protein